MRRTVLKLVIASTVAFACPVLAQTPPVFSADVLLRQQGLGQVRVSPDGRWIAYEVQAAYDSAPAYRFAQYTSQFLGRLEIYDAKTRAPRHVIEAKDRSAGFVAGPFSPDGARLIVYRLTNDSWKLGILTLETGEVRWTNITPEETQFGRSVGWRNADELLVVARPDHSLPLRFRVGHQTQERIADLWAATASGRRVGATWIPSGEARDERSQAVPLQLRQLNLSTGAEQLLAEGAIYDFSLSPDGGRLAVMEEGEDLQPRPDTPVRVGDPMRRRRLRLFDLRHGEVALARSLDYSPYFVAWRGDSGALLAFAREPGAGDFETAGFYVVVDADGQVEEMPRELGEPAIERSLWGEPVALGGWRGAIPVLRVQDVGGAARWRSTDGAVDVEALAGDRLLSWAGALRIRRGDRLLSLALEEIGAGALVGPGAAIDVGNRASWTPDADAWHGLRRGGCLQLRIADSPRCLPAPETDERVLASSPDGAFLVTREDRDDGASSFNVRFADDTRTLVTVNEDRADLAWGEIVEISHPDPTGELLKSWLLLPPNLPPGARAPLVVDVYVGRTSASAPQLLGRGSSRLQNNPAIIAAGGYAVLMVSLPNPPEGRYTGAELATRLLEIVDRAAADGRIETDRIALIGHSYGGYNVLLAAPHSPRFAAVVASNGAADLSTTFILPPLFRSAPEEGTPIGTSVGWSETGQAAIGPFPAAADRYVTLSPLYQVQDLTAPTLLIESDLDRPRYGALFGALYRLNREAAWLSYFGEGHTVASPANVRDLHARILAWLSRHLAPPVGDAGVPVASPRLQHGGE